MPGLDAGDVPHRHVGAGEVGLGHSLGHARGAQPVTQLGWVDLPQQVRLTGIHVRQCDRRWANPVKNGISCTSPAQMANWSRQGLKGSRSASTAPSSPGTCALRRATAGSFRVKSVTPGPWPRWPEGTRSGSSLRWVRHAGQVGRVGSPGRSWALSSAVRSRLAARHAASTHALGRTSISMTRPLS